MKICIRILIFIGVSAWNAGAQLPHYQAQVFGEEYGLSGGSLFDAFTDRSGFIWVSAPSNLQRFDGRNVKKYRFKENISHAMCDAEGRIWVVSGQTLWRNRPERDDFEHIAFDTSGGRFIRGIFQMRGRPLMLLVVDGLYACADPSGRFERLNLQIPPPGGRQSIVRIDTCGSALFYPMRGGGLCVLDLSDGQARTAPYRYEFSQLFALTPDLGILTAYGQECFWVDFNTGALRLMDAKQYGLSRSSSKMLVTGCASLGDGRFLMNTKYGLCAYDLRADRFERRRVFARGKPLEEELRMLRMFTPDAGKTFWAIAGASLTAIRPTENGLGLLRNYHFEGPEQWDNRVYSMADDGQGHIWMSGLTGFKRLDLQSGRVKTYRDTENATDRLAHPTVRGIAWDGQNVVLGPGNKGVWLYNPRADRYRRPVYANDTVRQKMEGDFIDYIGRMRNGDCIACGRFFLYRIRAGSYRAEFIRFDGDKDNMNYVMQDAQERVWLCTARSVICLDADYRLLLRLPLPDIAAIMCIFQHSEREFLFGARTGLYRLRLDDDGVAQTSAVRTPFDGQTLTGIYRDSLQRYWLSAHDGLFLADNDLKTFKRFDFADDIQSNVYHDGGVLRAANGMLFLAGVNGVNYCYPERVSMDDDSLSVSLQSVTVNDGDTVLYAISNGLRFRHSQNTLTFEAAAPYYYNAGKVQYRYRLRNRSEAWVYTGANNRFHLADLPAGDYILEIAAGISDQTWFVAPQSVYFTILPPFWRTWPFQMAVFAALAGAFIYFIRYRENRVQARQERQLEIEKLKNTNLLYQLEIEQVVNYFSQSIHAQTNIDDALWDVAQQCISRLGWEDCVIYLIDPQGQMLVQKAAWGSKSTPDRRIANPIEIPIGKGIVGSVAAAGRPELIPDTNTDPRYIVDDEQRQSELAVPIFSEGRVVGVIDSEHSQRGFYTSWHLQILTAIATLCGNKIMLLQLEKNREEVRRELEEKEKSLLEVEKRAAQIRLIALTNHLNPHFLFNSLTSLNSLIFENQQLASDYLQHLSKVYRYLLQHKDKETVSLRNEIDFVQNYIFLLKTRFGDDILVDALTPSNLLASKGIVPVTLQILIENAVKHNIIAASNPLRIRIETNGDALSVENNIQRKKQVENSNRQGLESLRALYRYLSDRPVEVRETETTFTVILPLLDV